MTHLQKLYIDPGKLTLSNSGTSESNLALDNFFKKTKSQTVWHSKEDYEYTYKNTKYVFTFSHSIIKRPRKEDKPGFKLDLFEPDKEPKGKGGYAIVYPIVATIIRTDDGQMLLKSGKKKLVKIQDHTAKDQIDSVHNEYINLLQAGHLRVKKPVISENDEEKKSYLIMEDVQGFTLEQILNPTKRLKIITEIPKLTVHKRLQLTLALLNAIKTQTVDRNLLHRDIKPGNIIVDLNNNPPKVKLIDFGFAIDKQQQDYRRLGTRAYRAPESFENNPVYSSRSDIYSAGRLLSYLWGDEPGNYYFSRTKDYNYIKTKSTNKNLFYLPEIDLFLDNIDRNNIRKYLNSMIKEDPDKRPDIEQLIHQFSKINMEQYLEMDVPQYSQLYLKKFEQKLSPQLMLVKQHLKLMNNKQRDLMARGHFDAADAMDKLIIKIKKNTEFIQCNPNPDYVSRYRKNCLNEINSSKNILKNHRDAYWLLAEITSAIALLGVGYLVALGINYSYSGRIGLFSQTKSDKLTDSLKDIISVDLHR